MTKNAKSFIPYFLSFWWWIFLFDQKRMLKMCMESNSRRSPIFFLFCLLYQIWFNLQTLLFRIFWWNGVSNNNKQAAKNHYHLPRLNIHIKKSFCIVWKWFSIMTLSLLRCSLNSINFHIWRFFHFPFPDLWNRLLLCCGYNRY